MDSKFSPLGSCIFLKSDLKFEIGFEIWNRILRIQILNHIHFLQPILKYGLQIRFKRHSDLETKVRFRTNFWNLNLHPIFRKWSLIQNFPKFKIYMEIWKIGVLDDSYWFDNWCSSNRNCFHSNYLKTRHFNLLPFCRHFECINWFRFCWFPSAQNLTVYSYSFAYLCRRLQFCVLYGIT